VTPLGRPARRPGPQITSREPQRAVWHGNAGPQPVTVQPSAQPPKWRRLPDRRPPQRAVTRRGAGLANALPPAFSIGTLTAADAPLDTLTAGTAASALTAADAPGATLTAGTSGAASGDGYQPSYPPYYGAPPSGTLTATDARTGGPQ
jgi:hypothetical protein